MQADNQKNIKRIPPKIKFCGMTRPQDVQYAVQLGVDAIGMILVPKSARGITLEHAVQLRSLIPAHINCVAVVQNPSVEWVEQIIQNVKPDVIQFHGDEPPVFCEQFKVTYWKVIAARNAAFMREQTQEFLNAAGLVFDTWSVSGSGGHGIGFDWSLIPHQLKNTSQCWVLAGGLTPENVAKATPFLEQGVIDIIDVSSGIETMIEPQIKGIKSQKAMECFFTEVKK